MASKVVKIGDQIITLKFQDFNDEIHADELLQIDYSNLLGEMLTFPIIVNKVGILLAEAESQLSEVKLNRDILEAKVKERLRKELFDQNGKNPTVEMLENALLKESGYQAICRKYIEVQKVRDYVSSLFWSCKDKSEKINKLSLTIQSGDVDENIIEGAVNNVNISKSKKLIK